MTNSIYFDFFNQDGKIPWTFAAFHIMDAVVMD